MEISLKSWCRKKCRVALFFSIINCAFIYYMVSFHSMHSSNNSSSEINSKKLFNRSMNIQCDYYFRIEYVILESPCQPLNTFQTVETMNALELMTNDKVNEILIDNLIVSLQIMKINATLQHLNRFNQKFFFYKRSEVVCNYVLELFTGMNFPQRCDSQCQLSALNRITAKMNSFDYSSDPLITFIPSSEDPIEYSIHNIFIHQSVKFYEENVFVKSIIENYHFTISTCDSDTFQPNVLMSTKTRSLFVLKKGLDLSDASSIYVSFASWSRPNYYLRHANGQLQMSFNDNSILFRQDSTFKLLFDQKKENCVIQAINLPNYHVLSFDVKDNSRLFLAKYDKPLIINEIDKQFLFTITPSN